VSGILTNGSLGGKVGAFPTMGLKVVEGRVVALCGSFCGPECATGGKCHPEYLGEGEPEPQGRAKGDGGHPCQTK
jgi:hypothetical protein